MVILYKQSNGTYHGYLFTNTSDTVFRIECFLQRVVNRIREKGM